MHRLFTWPLWLQLFKADVCSNIGRKSIENHPNCNTNTVFKVMSRTKCFGLAVNPRLDQKGQI